MFFKRKKYERIIEEIEPERSFLIHTNETRFIIHYLDTKFYARKVLSKDSRFGLITSLNGKKKYKLSDLDLGAEIIFILPRLNKEVSGGRVKRIAVR
ncbi:hypothetical protein HN681_05155 [archaeon]|jgi:hypothetical protein|nr:hypothetical protein [archaeon]MBT3731140.1 hypothetical protein [archaeon]MBT4669705.1 hypothetical protein [archaeon]MBT5030458.1 hypothetical protein [archaeon]MBT5287433.1 hypothetical protein [archaeon]